MFSGILYGIACLATFVKIWHTNKAICGPPQRGLHVKEKKTLHPPHAHHGCHLLSPVHTLPPPPPHPPPTPPPPPPHPPPHTHTTPHHTTPHTQNPPTHSHTGRAGGRTKEKKQEKKKKGGGQKKEKNKRLCINEKTIQKPSR